MPSCSPVTIDDFIEPDRILDGMRVAGKHFEGAHGAEGAVDEEGEVVGFDGARVTSFDDDGGLAADGGGVIEIPRVAGGVVGRSRQMMNVIEAESKTICWRCDLALPFSVGPQ